MSSVLLKIERGVATITLNRPERLNALSIDLAKRLAESAMQVGESDAEVVVLTGAGRAFCAGGDAQAMAEAEDSGAYLDELVHEAHRAVLALRSLPQPVVVRLNGAVAGAGIGLMLTADIAVAADSVVFTPAYGAIGLTPDCGVTISLPAAVGERRARDILLTGRRIDAATALEWGLVQRLVPDAGLDDCLHTVLSQIRRAGGSASRAAKCLLAAEGDYAERLELEREAIVTQVGTAFAQARLQVFTAH